MWKSLSKDARNSLTAVTAVLALFGFFWAFIALFRHVEMPDWLLPVAFGVYLLLLAVPALSGWFKRRRERSDPGSS